jgi:2-(1,2-epoxy-1,2-dihydrophenyl)acetyl-CoA isomerase
MDYKTLAVEIKGPVCILSLNRPETLNALCPEMRDDLMHFFDWAARDEDLRVLILTGKGRAFSAGGDLNMFKAAHENHRKTGQRTGFSEVPLQRAIVDFPKPMIAAVNGLAIGFGLTVTLPCDIRIASDQAQFSCAFVRIGVTPEFGSSYFLPRLIGYGKAAELAFTARMFDAREAERLGLVDRVVEQGRLLEEAEELARTICQWPADAVRMTKRVLRHGMQSTLDQTLLYEAMVFQDCTHSSEHYDAVCGVLKQIRTTP